MDGHPIQGNVRCTFNFLNQACALVPGTVSGTLKIRLKSLKNRMLSSVMIRGPVIAQEHLDGVSYAAVRQVPSAIVTFQF